jgi:lipopolysaccharide cholinephosphotransferase
MLVDVDKFCRDNDIKYSLSDGTLLGAVRHKGFIPWDDDIDITLDRENFSKFIATAKKSLPEQYEIVYDTWIRRVTRKDNPNKNAFPPEGCIDLFVFDKVPHNKKTEAWQVLRLKLLQGMLKTNVIYEGFSIKKKILLFVTHALGRIFPRKMKQKWYDSISQLGNNDELSDTIARFNGSYRGIDHVRYPASIIGSYENIEFECYGFMAITGWDKFLSTMYGDYMKLPEKNARKSIHEHIGLKE